VNGRNQSKTRASTVARYWYCAEQGRLLFSGLKAVKTEAMSRGSTVHRWLEQRPKTPTEQTLLERLAECKPHSRVHDGVEVFVHADDFKLVKRVAVVEEHKTIQSRSGLSYFEKYSLPCAELQARVYTWVMAPILESIGFSGADYATVYLFDRSGRQLKHYNVRYNEGKFLEELSQILRVYKGEEEPIPPSPLKCRHCKPPFSTNCEVKR